jgi:hypothetical protein
MSILSDAQHESALAVVAVRLGLPLDYTMIGGGHHEKRVRKGTKSVGYTALSAGTIEAAVALQPRMEGVRRLRSLAAQAGVGIVVDLSEGLRIGDVSNRSDVYSMVGIAHVLQIGNRSDDPNVDRFLQESVALARSTLLADDGAAWDSVSKMLEKRRRLSGDEVRELIEASDAHPLILPDVR